jgi:glyoxylase-like metal-dependent hydrolase (beta-lactamase superfamily II)
MKMQLQPARRKGPRYLNPVVTKVGGFSVMLKVGPQFVLGTKVHSPRAPLGPFHTDPVIYATEPRSGLRITWMGHATSIVEIDGTRILIDPVWDERASPTNWSGPKRFFPPPLDLSDLPAIDAVIVSHDHYDHLGAGTIRALSKLPAVEKARWITPLGVGALLKRFGVPAARCLELNWMDHTQVGAVRMTALLRNNSHGDELEAEFPCLGMQSC